MSDLFRGFDLTTVAEMVAKKHWTRELAAAPITDESKAQRTWDKLPALAKHNIKEQLLPVITDVLDALESETVKPMPAKQMGEYNYSSRTDTSSSFYENIDAMHDMSTCTVWVVHMNVHPSVKDAVLESMSTMAETTGEYTYGDSWKEWGEDTDDDTNRHLAIYFDATPNRAKEVGDFLVTVATFAAMRSMKGDNATIPPHAISTSGDYAEQFRD